MSSIGAKLLDSLRSVERPGDFCVGGIREVFMPAIDVDGVGRIAFPILPAQAERLVAIAEAAPYGRGEETVVDRDVRRTWQVDSAKVRIGGRHWEKTLSELVAGVAAGLGVSGPLAADFYKLLVYDAGSFFVDHRDTEKVPGMFATMVLVLPSTHGGGELVVKHAGREAALDLHPEEPSEIGFAGFYADCVHELRPVTTGFRVTLVYNLRFADKSRPLTAPDYRSEQARVAEVLRTWASAEDEPDKLILPLEHAYTPAELSFGALKGADAGVASVLVKAAAEADCDLHLALVSIEESGGAEHTGYGGGRWGRDEEDEEFEVAEVCDRALMLVRVAASGRRRGQVRRFSLYRGRALPARRLRGSGAGRGAFSRGDRQRGRVVRAHLSPRRPRLVARRAQARGAEPGRPRHDAAVPRKSDGALGGGRRNDTLVVVAGGR